MFEPPQVKQESKSSPVWIGVIVIVIAVAAGMLYMMTSKAPTPVASAPAAPAAKADPIKDLKIQRAVMDKDSTGTSVWAIAIENRSPAYSYSNIEYETSYLGADGKVIASNKGTLSLTLSPQGEKSTQLRDLSYPNGTAGYKFRITSAASQAE